MILTSLLLLVLVLQIIPLSTTTTTIGQVRLNTTVLCCQIYMHKQVMHCTCWSRRAYAVMINPVSTMLYTVHYTTSHRHCCLLLVLVTNRQHSLGRVSLNQLYHEQSSHITGNYVLSNLQTMASVLVMIYTQED